MHGETLKYVLRGFM